MTTTARNLRDMFEIGQHPIDLVSQRTRTGDGFVVEELVFATDDGEKVRGILTSPTETDTPAAAPAPAILYIHAHGNRHDIGAGELLNGRPALQGPLGPVFATQGYVTLTIDLPGFGERKVPNESSRTKALAWRGKSLAGQMVGELASALSYLSGREDVRSDSIGVFGISMGATFGYWLAAVDDRITCVMHLCCFADFAKMITTGAHDLHGHYLTIPGLLNVAGNGEIAGLIAPRPQLICIGEQDPLTPPDAVSHAFASTEDAYSRIGARDRLVLYRERQSGHSESGEMRKRVLEFAGKYLRPGHPVARRTSSAPKK